MNRLTRLVAPLALMLLSACAIGPSTKVHPAPSPAATPAPRPAESRPFFDSLVAISPLAAAAPLPGIDTTAGVGWIEVLRDSTVISLVRTALVNNRQLQAASARVREYRALYGVAQADLYPRIDANATSSRQRFVLGSIPPALFSQVRATADMQWELDFWGRIRRQGEAGKFDYLGRDEDRQSLVLTLVSDVVGAYLDLRALDEDLRVAQQTLASRENTLKLARQRFSQGLISELDVRQFEAQVAGPAGNVAQFTRLRSESENRLNVLMGRTPGPVPRGDSLMQIVRAVAVPDSVSSSLLARRPDVMSSQSDYSAALARVGVAQGARLPRVSITGSYGYTRPDFNDLFSADGQVYALTAGVSLPLFTGGRLLNQQRAASARAEQARARYEQSVLVAIQEASDALTALRLRRDELAAQESQTRALRRALVLALERYQSGVSSYFEVLDAQRGVFSAELGLIQSERDFLDSTVRLYKALGGHWQ